LERTEEVVGVDCRAKGIRFRVCVAAWWAGAVTRIRFFKARWAGEGVCIYRQGGAKLGLASNGLCHPSCCDGPRRPRAQRSRLTGGSGGPSMTRWLVSCQARPITPRAMLCLGQV
jgi:hypothetical protein